MLLEQEPHIGGEGMKGAGLSLDQLKLLQRFDPSAVTLQGMDINSLQDSREDDLISLANKDCIGFFIAKFIKSNSKYGFGNATWKNTSVSLRTVQTWSAFLPAAMLPSQRADGRVAMAALRSASCSDGKEPQVAAEKSWLGEGQYHF